MARFRTEVRLACAAILLLLGPASLPLAAQTTSTATPLSHVFVIMQENHSFDNYFGTYPTANGSLVDNVTSKLTPVNGIPNHVCLNYSGGCISPTPTNTTSPTNPVEGQLTYENDYGTGSNFATSSGPQSMVYFDYRTIPAYWDYAEEYGIGDNYFAAVLSMTTPNRLMLLTGDSPVSENYGPPPSSNYSSSVFGQLAAAGDSWGYYDLIGSGTSPTSFYPLNYISGLDDSKDTIQNISVLTQQLKSGSGLPSVVFVSFLGNLSLTEHPPFSPTAGEAQVVSLVNSVMESTYWDSSAIFITWDEGGGFFDHVTPPREFQVDHNFSNPLLGLGQRIPLLVISPFSKINYVSHVQFSHLSLLHFIEYNWDLPALNEGVASSNIPLDFFNFSQTERAPLPLGAGNSKIEYPIPLQTLPPSSAGFQTAWEYLTIYPGDLLTALGVLLIVGGIIVLVYRNRKGGRVPPPPKDDAPSQRPP